MPLFMNKIPLPFVLDSVDQMGIVLATRRYDLALTQSETAELAGISLRNLKQIEAGKANPGLQPLLRLLYVLGLVMTLDKRTSL